jgi:hypothetical protein
VSSFLDSSHRSRPNHRHAVPNPRISQCQPGQNESRPGFPPGRFSPANLTFWASYQLSLAPLSSGNSWRVGFVGEHGSVDDVGEPAFEDAKGFPAAVATVGAPLEQFTSCWVTPGLSQGDTDCRAAAYQLILISPHTAERLGCYCVVIRGQFTTAESEATAADPLRARVDSPGK